MAADSTKLKFQMREMIEKHVEDVKNLKFLSTDALKSMGDVIVQRIVDRTRYGVGVENPDDEGIGEAVRFKGYTKNYAKKRQGEGLPTSRVDLTFTGHLLDNLEVKKVQKNGAVVIGIDPDDTGKARGAHEGIRTKQGLVKRPFLGLTKTDVAAIMPRIGYIINKEYAQYLKNKKGK